MQRNLSNDDVDSMRASVTSLSSLSSLADSSARYKATLSANKPLQVTLSKKSLSLIKDTVEVCVVVCKGIVFYISYTTYRFSLLISAVMQLRTRSLHTNSVHPHQHSLLRTKYGLKCIILIHKLKTTVVGGTRDSCVCKTWRSIKG